MDRQSWSKGVIQKRRVDTQLIALNAFLIGIFLGGGLGAATGSVSLSLGVTVVSSVLIAGACYWGLLVVIAMLGSTTDYQIQLFADRSMEYSTDSEAVSEQ